MKKALLLILAAVLIVPVILTGCALKRDEREENIAAVPADIASAVKRLSKESDLTSDYSKTTLSDIAKLGDDFSLRLIKADQTIDEKLASVIFAFQIEIESDETALDAGAEFEAIAETIKASRKALASLDSKLAKASSEKARKELISEYTFPAFKDYERNFKDTFENLVLSVEEINVIGILDAFVNKNLLEEADSEIIKGYIFSQILAQAAIAKLQAKILELPETVKAAAKVAQALDVYFYRYWIVLDYEYDIRVHDDVITEYQGSAPAFFDPDGLVPPDEWNQHFPMGGVLKGAVRYVDTLGEDAPVAAGKARPLQDYMDQLNIDTNAVLVDKSGNILEGTPEIGAKSFSISDEDDGDFYIITEINRSADSLNADICVVGDLTNDIYPGAVLHADEKFVNGDPSPVVGIPRQPITVALDISDAPQGEVVENPTKAAVMASINRQLKEWSKTHSDISAQASYEMTSVSDSKQLDIDLGIKGAADKFSVDMDAVISGKKQVMFVTYTQIYYSAYIDTNSNVLVDDIFTSDVTVDELKRQINEENPAAVAVTRVDFGRTFVVKLETESQSTEVKAAWSAAFNGTKVENTNKYKDVMDKTTIQMFIYGGKDSNISKAVTLNNITELVSFLTAKEDAIDCAEILSYKTNFIHNGESAKIKRTSQYVETIREKRQPIHVKLDTAYGYSYNAQKFYVRKITGIDEETGAFKLGKWILYLDTTSGSNQEFYVPANCAEFAYSFDIFWGTDWPFTGQFWRLADGAAKDILISMGGGCRTANIDIYVNDKKIISQHNCGSHSEWKP